MNYHFKGLKNTRFGRVAVAHWGPEISPGASYPTPYIEVGSIPHPRCSTEVKRQSISDALDELVRRSPEDFGCFADVDHARNLLEVLDVDRLFAG